ncbi:MAG: hypothetical protein NVS3B25_07360 [Hymenobacter sp.]
MTDTAACLTHYGDPGTAAFQAKWLHIFELPADIAAHFPPYPGVGHVTRIEMNRFAWEPFCAAFRDLIATGLVSELKTYDGCVCLRYKRGMAEVPANRSIHSWGLALDFNAAQNPLAVALGARKGMFSKAYLDVWRRHGWTCGADFTRPDVMHVQLTNTFPTGPSK